MTEAQREQVDELFGDLLELDAEAQAEALAGVEDAEVLAEVRSLLEHSGGGVGRGLGTSIGKLMESASDAGAFEDRAVGPGTRFERYRIERKLGQGGMGDVYEATRENDFHKRVALKIVRYGLDSEFARGRFQQERQTLAGLEHPYIARLIDGGEAANGCPYLVLEFVDGVAIDEYVPGRKRDEVLALFLKVCEAVEYAHRNLIIHRDLKPANILVTADGTPKLLDFGIAKLLDANADATQTMSVALTPQYASPEQVRSLPITTASDVYSLGVVLYQLLTGRRPYQIEIKTATELDRVVCELPPVAPGLGDELDDILLMALRKEPERRYASVAALAEDIERFREGRPVLAAPDTLRYRARKYIGRHWVGLAATGAAMLALLVGAGVAMYQAHVAKERLAQVRGLTQTVLFDVHDQLVPIPGTLHARGLIVTTAQGYLMDMRRNTSADPGLLMDLAQSYVRLGDAQGSPYQANLNDRAGAEASYLEAIRLYDEVVRKTGKHHMEAVVTRSQLLTLYANQSDFGKARALIPSTLALAASLKADRSVEEALSLERLYLTLAEIDSGAEDFNPNIPDAQKAAEFLRRWAALPERKPGDTVSTEMTNTHVYLGIALIHKGELSQAEDELKTAATEREAAVQLQPQNVQTRTITAVVQGDVGLIYDSVEFPSLEDGAAAALWQRKALDTLRPALEGDAADVSANELRLISLACLAYDLSQARAGDGSGEAYQAMDLWKTLRAKSGPRGEQAQIDLNVMRGPVIALRRAYAFRQAIDLATLLLSERRRLLGAHPSGAEGVWHLARDLSTLAVAEQAAGDFAAAGSRLDEALALVRPLIPSADRNMASAFAVADLYEALRVQSAAGGRCAESESWRSQTAVVWRGAAVSSPYASQRLRKAESASSPCRRLK